LKNSRSQEENETVQECDLRLQQMKEATKLISNKTSQDRSIRLKDAAKIINETSQDRLKDAANRSAAKISKKTIESNQI
jgi:hypothetical protein